MIKGTATGDAVYRTEVLNDPTLPEQGYRLEIRRSGIKIFAEDDAGLRYAQGTLEQLQEQHPGELPCLRIRDWPDFPVRGYMLDISRDRVPTMRTLDALIDRLARLRINQLQLYTEHTFAYSQHEAVWQDASPMTADEIRKLDKRCRERGIELVANQNSFGHMERWLRHETYRGLAEQPDADQPACLYPSQETSRFLQGLYTELLPCFESPKINIGCDETFELGCGRSAAACNKQGRGRVYFDFLMQIVQSLQQKDHEVQFWGDIVLEQRALIRDLPKEKLTALAWWYEAPNALDPGFSARAPLFAEAGVPFFVCPGTSSWNSLIGRLPNALGNLLDAAKQGVANGAGGYLITDWGDYGHHQPYAISQPGLTYGAAVSWCVDSNRDLVLEDYVDPKLLRLGRVYESTGLLAGNATVLGIALRQPLDAKWKIIGEIDETRLQNTMDELASIQDELDDPEVIQAVRLAKHALRRIELAKLGSGLPLEEMRTDLMDCIHHQRDAWLRSSRPGGLEDSLDRLRARLADYGSN